MSLQYHHHFEHKLNGDPCKLYIENIPLPTKYWKAFFIGCEFCMNTYGYRGGYRKVSNAPLLDSTVDKIKEVPDKIKEELPDKIRIHPDDFYKLINRFVISQHDKQKKIDLLILLRSHTDYNLRKINMKVLYPLSIDQVSMLLKYHWVPGIDFWIAHKDMVNKVKEIMDIECSSKKIEISLQKLNVMSSEYNEK